jgi:hypothetical protein
MRGVFERFELHFHGSVRVSTNIAEHIDRRDNTIITTMNNISNNTTSVLS